MSKSDLNAVRKTLTERELLVVDRLLFPAEGVEPMSVAEIADLRGIKVHSAEKLVSIVRGKLQAAGIEVVYAAKPRSLMPLMGRTQAGRLKRLHISLEKEGYEHLENLAAQFGTSMGAIANDAIMAALYRYAKLADGRG